MQARVCSILVAIVAHVATAATVSSDFELKARFFPGGSWTPAIGILGISGFMPTVARFKTLVCSAQEPTGIS